MRLQMMFFLALALAGCAHTDAGNRDAARIGTVPVNVHALEGTWKVDLRTSPTDAPYSQPFVVEKIDEAKRTITGSFYNSEISWSRYSTAWGRLVVTFMTSDGSGDYVHTATFAADGTLTGTSTAKHRNLLVSWVAARQ